MPEVSDEPFLVLAQGQVGRWQAEVVMLPDQQGACIQLASGDKVEQCLAFNSGDLGQVLQAIMVAGAHLDTSLERLDGPYTGLERRTLPATGCLLLSIVMLNDAGVPVGVAFQLGWVEDGTIEPFDNPADNLTLAKADVPALVGVAWAAVAAIETGATLARLGAEPPAGSA